MELIYSVGQGGAVRCGRCGNENSDANRFCGMCGAPLVANAQATTTPAVTHGEKKEEPAASPTRAASGRSSGITPPSFLGLNDLPSGARTRNLDYLLEDEEEPRGGSGKAVLVVIALLLAAGFGYLRWKQGGFDWVTNQRKPAAAVNGPQSKTESGEASGSGPSASNTPTASAPGANPSGASATPEVAPPGAGGTAAAPAAAADTGSTATPAPSPNPSSENAAPPQSAEASSEKPADSSAAGNTAAAPAASESAATAKPETSTRKTRERKPTPVTPVDNTATAERYLYGRGVPQNCDHGLRLLKPAAQSSARAMITMGALYSTGTCTPRDLPTAYRWFAMALHKEPDNPALQNDLQKLWGQMTQPERQLAIKLSQ